MKLRIPPSASRITHRAFTLIELVLVLTILALIMGAAIYSFNRGGLFEASAEKRIKGDVESTISVALEAYFFSAGRYPTTEQGLEALVEKPTKAPIPDKWHSFLKVVPTDPWAQPYKYRYPATKSKDAFDVYSIGKDGQEGTADDQGNWTSTEQK